MRTEIAEWHFQSKRTNPIYIIDLQQKLILALKSEDTKTGMTVGVSFLITSDEMLSFKRRMRAYFCQEKRKIIIKA